MPFGRLYDSRVRRCWDSESIDLWFAFDKLTEKKKEERDNTEEGEDHLMILDNDDKAGDELFIDDSM